MNKGSHNMNTLQMELIVKLVETGSLNKTATFFHTTYQVVSYHICSVESELGAELFRRSNKGCQVTNEGRLVYEFVKNTLNNYASLKNSIHAMNEIKIGIDIRHIPPDFLDYITNQSSFRVALIPIDYEDVLKCMNDFIIDCYLGYERDSNIHLSFTPLVKDSLGVAVIASSPIAKKNVVDYSDLDFSTIYIGKFGLIKRNEIVNSIHLYCPECEIIENSVESLAIANIYSGRSVGLMPCGYSFIFNDKVKVIPLRDESLSFGVYSFPDSIKTRGIIKEMIHFLVNGK